MKLPFVIILCFLPFLLLAEYTLEVRGAYYHPQSKSLRKRFGNSWYDFQVEASKFLCDNVELWGATDWIVKKKRFRERFDYSFDYSEENRHYTRLWILPLSIGGKYHFFVNPCLSIYLGAGAAVTFLNIHNSSSFSKHHAAEARLGAVLKSGIHYDYGDYTFFDFFVDYFYQRINISHAYRHFRIDSGHLDLSGPKIGLGLGVYF